MAVTDPTVTGNATKAIGGWLRSLEELVSTPPEHRGDSVPWAEALRILRCPESILQELVDRGLQCDERDGDRFVERADLYNVALRSGSGRSLPELGAVFIRRLRREGVVAWTQRRQWDVRLELRCPLGSDCGVGPWALARPVPSALGGSDGRWQIGDDEAPPTGSITAPSSKQFFAVKGSFATQGAVADVLSRAAQDAYAATVDNYRYQVLSLTWAEDLDSLRSARVADCVGIANILAEACRELGYDADVDSGLLLGTFGFSRHRWVRVLDDDGRWKILEPTLPLMSRLGRDQDPEADAEFTRFCCGSSLNRIVACEALDSGELAEHFCHGHHRRPEIAIRAHAKADRTRD